MDGANSDNISVLANNLASLKGLGPHATMDSDAVGLNILNIIRYYYKYYN